MKVHSAFWLRIPGLLCNSFAAGFFTLTLLMATTSRAPAASSTVPGGASTNQVAPALEVPKSVFVIPNNPREGRNPFFPGSHAELPPSIKPSQPVDVSSFVLNGITSPPKVTAMINGRTFEVGEEGRVRLPSGALELIKCIEVGADSAIIEYKGQRLQLHYRSNP
jgi:hypothetical protein